jgi:hypothetical protein
VLFLFNSVYDTIRIGWIRCVFDSHGRVGEASLCSFVAVFFVHLVGKTICRSKFMRGAICYHQLSVVVRASRRVIYVRRPGCAGARVWQCSGFGLSVRADFES